MNVVIEKLSDVDMLRRLCDATRPDSAKPSTMTLEKIYMSEHSPIRSQLFYIRLEGVKTFVSVHLARHKIGVEHYVKSNRDDRGGDTEANRHTPVSHTMLINAQAILTMSRDRLCYTAHRETVATMTRIRRAMVEVDLDLARLMVPKCVYKGFCSEPAGCAPGVVAVLTAYKDSPYHARRELTNRLIQNAQTGETTC